MTTIFLILGVCWQELGWIAHVKRLTGRHPHDMTTPELREAGLEHAHPSSKHWVQQGPRRDYPVEELNQYTARHAAASSTAATARRDAMFAHSTLPDAFAPAAVQNYKQQLFAQ